MTFNNFAEDVQFLKKHVETIVLGENGGPQIAVVPAYQGRTMTSTTGTSTTGLSKTGTSTNGNSNTDSPKNIDNPVSQSGISFGWINYDCVASQKVDPKINLFGGEDRFWLGPEGSQFSIFFDPDAPMEFSNWRTPKVLDTESFDLIDQTNQSLSFRKKASIRNYRNFDFELQMDRTVELLDEMVELEKLMRGSKSEIDVSKIDVSVVAHQSRNTVTNVGDVPWQQATGLLGVWMLCMNKPSGAATIIVPFKRGPESELGPILNADYFGKLDERRLKVDQKRGLIFFLGDGKFRSKIGLSFARAMPTLGAWDPSRKTLTIADYNLPDQAPDSYTNNLWEVLENPYDGDVVNSYNDGPNESGGMLGPFYELETLSPALALAPGKSYTHSHRTIHIEGDPDQVNVVCESVFGLSLSEVESQFSA